MIIEDQIFYVSTNLQKYQINLAYRIKTGIQFVLLVDTNFKSIS